MTADYSRGASPSLPTFTRRIAGATALLTAGALASGLLAGAPAGVEAAEKGQLAAGALSAGAVDSHESPTALTAGTDISAGDDAFVTVTVATLWKSPSSPRKADEPALGNPVDPGKWNSNLSSTAKRRDLTGRTETQAVYGDRVHVYKVDGDWARVGVYSQPNPGNEKGYEAWVPVQQLVRNDAFGTTSSKRATAIVQSKKTTVATSSGTVTIPMNTRLPVLDSSSSRIRVIVPDGRFGHVPAKDAVVLDRGDSLDKPSGADLVKTAEQFEGLKYLWGGTSAYGFDCSGFTYSVYRAHGIAIPRDSGPQAEAGRTVKLSELKKGDLIFFASRGGAGTIYHVGMYIGGGKMIHAPNASRAVEIVRIKAWSGFGDYAGARRVL